MNTESNLPPSTDLAALFNLDIDGGSNNDGPAISAIICGKCHGKGTFIGWSGKTIGKCFTCDGSGIKRQAAIEIKPGDCAKCAGTGEWRPGRPCFTCNGTGQEVKAATINVSAIQVAFAAAR